MPKNIQQPSSDKQDKSTSKLNNLFPLPNPSPSDIQKTFEDMGKTIVTEMNENRKSPEPPKEDTKSK